jgi:hypothetical protein
MPKSAVKPLLETVLACVRETNRECCSLLEGVEYGLVNVKWQFQRPAKREVGKTLTDELLIGWLVGKKLGARGFAVRWEERYPGNPRKKCDLVIRATARSELWLELKLASKAWFNCQGGPTYRNSVYRSYLEGTHRIHSFKHDFEKLTTPGETWAATAKRAVCLVGFDCVREPMDAEVKTVVTQARRAGHRWSLAAEDHWPDRRSADFRINAWCWLLQWG